MLISWSRMLVPASATFILAMSIAPAGFAQDQVGDEADDKAKIRQLEERVARLEALIQQLSKQMISRDGKPDQAVAVASDADLAELKLQIRENHAQLEQKLGERDARLQQLANDFELQLNSDFAVGDTKVSYGGYIKLDAISSFYSDVEGPSSAVQSNSLGRDFYIPALVPAGGGGSAHLFDFNPRETRFVFKTETPAGDHVIETLLGFDFQVTNGGNERISNSYLPRIRQGYIKYRGLMVGQIWSTFTDVGALPDNLDFIGTPEGAAFNRQPLIRYITGPWEFALENAETTLTTSTGARVLASGDRWPDLVARYTHKGDFGRIRIAGLLRELRNDVDIQPAANTDSIIGYGISLSGVIKAGERDDFRFMLNAGDGVGRYFGLNLANGAAIDQDGNLRSIPAFNGFGAYRHFWSDSWRSSAGFSFFTADNPTRFTSENVTERMWSTHANLLYSPEPRLTFGVEYRYARRILENGNDGNLSRIMFSAKYGF